ncbi:MAG: ankyrin repeat domain-containing protein [Alphaproteobacteria bacterium]
MFTEKVLKDKLIAFERILQGGVNNFYCAQMCLANIEPKEINKIYIIDEREKTFLSVACVYSDIPIVEYMLEKLKADVKLKNAEALKIAFENNDLALVRVLIKYGAIVPSLQIILTHIAVKNNNFELVKLVIESNNSKLDKNTLGQCLLKSVDNRNYDLAKYLIENGAEVDYCDERKQETPVSLAIHRDDTKILNLLVTRGANLYIAKIETALKKLHTENRIISLQICEILDKADFCIDKIYTIPIDGDNEINFFSIDKSRNENEKDIPLYPENGNFSIKFIKNPFSKINFSSRNFF